MLQGRGAVDIIAPPTSICTINSNKVEPLEMSTFIWQNNDNVSWPPRYRSIVLVTELWCLWLYNFSQGVLLEKRIVKQKRLLSDFVPSDCLQSLSWKKIVSGYAVGRRLIEVSTLCPALWATLEAPDSDLKSENIRHPVGLRIPCRGVAGLQTLRPGPTNAVQPSRRLYYCAVVRGKQFPEILHERSEKGSAIYQRMLGL